MLCYFLVSQVGCWDSERWISLLKATKESTGKQFQGIGQLFTTKRDLIQNVNSSEVEIPAQTIFQISNVMEQKTADLIY